MNWLHSLLDRFANWYWRDPVQRKRHEIEEAARAYGGEVTWRDDNLED